MFGWGVSVQGTAYAENGYGVSEESRYLCTAVNEGGGWTTRDIAVANW